MKIIHIITRLIVGGAQENTLINCKLLADAGHEVTLITGPALGPEGGLFEKTQDEKYKVLVVEQLVRPIHPVVDLLAYYKIKGILQGLQPDVVHTHSAKAGIIGRLAAHRVKRKKGGRPVVVHGVHGLSFHKYQSRWLNFLYKSIERKAAKWTDKFICVADAMTRQSLEAGIGKKDQYVTAYSAIEEAEFLKEKTSQEISEFRKKYGIGEDDIVLTTVARLFMLKGHDFIIKSARHLAEKYPEVKWLFVGDGNLSEFYQEQVAKLGLSDRVRFSGLLRPDEIPMALRSSDILLHCSLREGLARAIPQGMLCGVPAIAFNLDGTPEVVNENTGRMVEPGDLEGFVSACEELIEDEKLRKKLGANAQKEVTEKFAPRTMVNTIENVYLELLGKQGVKRDEELQKGAVVSD